MGPLTMIGVPSGRSLEVVGDKVVGVGFRLKDNTGWVDDSEAEATSSGTKVNGEPVNLGGGAQLDILLVYV